MIFTKLTENGYIIFNESSYYNFDCAANKIRAELASICREYRTRRIWYNAKILDKIEKENLVIYHLYCSNELDADYSNMYNISSKLDALKYSKCRYIKSVDHNRDGDIYVYLDPTYLNKGGKK